MWTKPQAYTFPGKSSERTLTDFSLEINKIALFRFPADNL